jgi:hypothetical protein
MKQCYLGAMVWIELGHLATAKRGKAKSNRQSSIGGPGQLCNPFSGSTPISLRIHPLLVPLPL